MYKKFTALALINALFLLQIPTASASSFNCGEWRDVPASRLDVLTDVCNYGLMQGNSETDFGYGEGLSRAAAATIVNRFIFGSTYDELGVTQDEYARYLYEKMTSLFTDLPDYHEYSNEWMIKAMYYSAVGNDIFSGDGDTSPTTYRPAANINIVETFKVFLEAAKEAELLRSGLNNNISISYNTTIWWEELMNFMEDENVLLHLNTTDQTFWLGSPLTVSYTNFNSDVKREDAAYFLYMMINNGLIDQDALLNYEFDPDR